MIYELVTPTIICSEKCIFSLEVAYTVAESVTNSARHELLGC